ncbi:MAG: amidohydrolase family protein [Candidatus Latescibacterota bacterium]
MYDIVLRHGTIVDGTRQPAYRADLAIQGDRIAAIGAPEEEPARLVLDVSGRTVAPGFVDVHNHTDGWLLKTANFRAKTLQGFTTEVLMSDGISYAPVDERTRAHWFYYLLSADALHFAEYRGWESIDDYMRLLDGRSAQNAIAQIPYGNVRSLACGFGRGMVDDFQMDQITARIRAGMAEGAAGLSTGMDYIAQCFAGTDELVEACRAMADRGGIYATHVRYRRGGTLAGVQEAVEIGRRAGVPVHISHMKASKPAEIDALLSYVDRVAVNEVDFTFDVYPYLPGSTMLNYMLPHDVFEEGPLGVLPRLADRRVRAQFAASLATYPLERMHIAWLPGARNARFIGRLVSQYVEEVGRPAEDALADLLIEESMAVLLVFHHGADELVHPFLQHDRFMLGTDGIFFPDGTVHPRVYGSVGRILGPCVRQHRLFSLEDAVHKLSAFPAARFGLKDRGTLEAGRFADVVVFDAESITDRATYAEPHQLTVGVEHVLVNGVPVVRDGQALEDLPEPRPGRYLRFRE